MEPREDGGTEAVSVWPVEKCQDKKQQTAQSEWTGASELTKAITEHRKKSAEKNVGVAGW